MRNAADEGHAEEHHADMGQPGRRLVDQRRGRRHAATATRLPEGAVADTAEGKAETPPPEAVAELNRAGFRHRGGGGLTWENGPLFAQTLKLILSLDGRKPAPSLPRRLDGLFRELTLKAPSRPAYEIEDLIWALWIDHEDSEAARRMERAIAGIARKQFDTAEEDLSDLVRDYPDWAEAWNKRATLYFVLNRDAESVADIERTLELEPRHFGAICGFAQICLRNGEAGAAATAFESALRINPHLDAVKAAVEELNAERRRSLN
jgi:tetratricopeptide (TPR) repeat protein